MRKTNLLLLIVAAMLFLGGCSLRQMVKDTAVNQQISRQEGSSDEKTTPEESPSVEKAAQQEGTFTDEELADFELIKKYYDGFNYSGKYSLVSDNTKKMIFTKEDDLYFGQYLSYEVVYNADARQVDYAYDCGTALRGYGTYLIIDEETVLCLDKSFGTSAYGYEVSKNGTQIDEEFSSY